MKHVTRSFFGSAPRRAVCIVLLLAFAAATSWAEPVVITGSSGSLQATLRFEMVEGQLWITLSNTSEADALVPTDMLGGVFFDVANNPTLTPVWARVDTGSCLIYPTDAGCTSPAEVGPVYDNLNIGGEWNYNWLAFGSTSPVPTGQLQGIRAVGYADGLGSLGWSTLSPNIAGPDAVDGGNFSLAPRGDIPTTGNGGINNNDPYVRYSAVFAFDVPDGFALGADTIRNVRFQYGTDFSGPWIPDVPEPATLAMIGGGLIALGFLRRRAAVR